jgi:HB1, ASXL, restriction endonuclease HTH domain
MSRSTANHQTVIRCDSPVCPSRSLQDQDRDRFITYSMAMRARRQAQAAGWQRLPAWTVTTEDSPRRLYDICPREAPAALERKGRRSEILAAERAAKKATRAEAKAAAALARIEKRDQRARIKAEKIAARERRAILKAEKLAARERRAAERASRVAADVAAGADVELPVADVELTDAAVELVPTAPSPSTPRVDSPILAVVARMLLARGQPMRVTEIVEHAIGDLALPTASKTPRTIVARDLAIDIKKHGEASRFMRVAPGTFALRGAGHDA